MTDRRVHTRFVLSGDEDNVTRCSMPRSALSAANPRRLTLAVRRRSRVERFDLPQLVDQRCFVDYDWEAVGEILDGDLYTARGFDSGEAFLKAVVKVPKRTAIRMIRVARYA